MSCVGRLCKDYLYLYNSLPLIPTLPLIMAVNIGEVALSHHKLPGCDYNSISMVLFSLHSKSFKIVIRKFLICAKLNPGFVFLVLACLHQHVLLSVWEDFDPLIVTRLGIGLGPGLSNRWNFQLISTIHRKWHWLNLCRFLSLFIFNKMCLDI